MSLIFISDSKQWLYNSIGISSSSLNNCLSQGSEVKLYLNRFVFSLEVTSEFPKKNIMGSEDLI